MRPWTLRECGSAGAVARATAARYTWDYHVGGGFTRGLMEAWLNFTRWLIKHRRH
jgi:hypothetical protein